MAVSFDTLAAAEAMESAGVEARQARAIAAQLHAAASATEAVTRPELQAALAELKGELLDRIAESERGLVDRIAESERRMAALLWRLFGGIVAVAGVAIAVLKYYA